MARQPRSPGSRTGLLLTVVLVAMLVSLLWLSLSALSTHEEALRQSERRITRTLESITDGFVAYDRAHLATNDLVARQIKPRGVSRIAGAIAAIGPDIGNQRRHLVAEQLQMLFAALEGGLGLLLLCNVASHLGGADDLTFRISHGGNA